VAIAGGEVFSHVEDMGNTRFYNLAWGKIPNTTGILSAKFWGSNQQRIYQGRYSCTVSSVADHRCGP
jgi:hypothetical protein